MYGVLRTSEVRNQTLLAEYVEAQKELVLSHVTSKEEPQQKSSGALSLARTDEPNRVFGEVLEEPGGQHAFGLQ